jgi:anti-anti-sigma factor
MKLEFEKTLENETIHVEGAVRGRDVGELVQHLRNSLMKRIVLDLSKVTCLDSCGIGALIYISKLISLYHKEIILVSPDDPVRRLLQEYRIDRMLTILEQPQWESEVLPHSKAA